MLPVLLKLLRGSKQRSHQGQEQLRTLSVSRNQISEHQVWPTKKMNMPPAAHHGTSSLGTLRTQGTEALQYKALLSQLVSLPSASNTSPILTTTASLASTTFFTTALTQKQSTLLSKSYNGWGIKYPNKHTTHCNITLQFRLNIFRVFRKIFLKIPPVASEIPLVYSQDHNL